MQSINLKVTSESGLHARPAGMLASLAGEFESKIIIELNGKKANGKSIISILGLGASNGDEIIIHAEGNDETNAVEALSDLINVKLVHE